MIEIVPDIHCIDYWPQGIPDDKLQTYKAMIDAGMITRRTAIVNQRMGSVAVDYMSKIPHDWILREMREAKA